MRKVTKVVVLIITLLVPVIIYIFLKTFGTNQYDLPIFYEQGVISSSSVDCSYAEGKVHTIPDFELFAGNGEILTGTSIQDHFSVFHFFKSTNSKENKDVSFELARVQDAFSEPQLKILSIAIDSVDQEGNQFYRNVNSENKSNWIFLNGDKSEIQKLLNCGFVIWDHPTKRDDSFPLVLIDKEKRIRGYYDGGSRKEVDRLILEINVLLN
ncbi:SCO family protein [Fulvivirgaceae bacterium BMA10]|uniref:SCO family protein n=1 Tax=Splendidivirga corallicola TaxID=3051826 RepID=A0ABT8KQ43_9BACT|nr:SCO family protein [Fulvivirgaceae bacterium BMA10]